MELADEPKAEIRYICQVLITNRNSALKNRRASIVATGSYIPEKIVKNEDFYDNVFYDAKGEEITTPIETTVQKFEEITGISERRYVTDDLVCSDIAYFAAKDALDSSDIDKETIDFIIVAHNFGDVAKGNRRSDMVPSIAARVKNRLEIHNPYTVAYDVVFGCPGWLQGMIQADALLGTRPNGRALVIGAETLSRVSDPHDRDSMIYSDGAGATIVESVSLEEGRGALAAFSRSDTVRHSRMLWMGSSNKPDYPGKDLFLKMQGHNLYKYALSTVPSVAKECLERSELNISEVKYVLIHQANNKMDEEILKRLFAIYDLNDMTQSRIQNVMPMTIARLGNSSVATLPTMIDLITKKKSDYFDFDEPYDIEPGDVAVITSVGAGMNINAMAYRF